MNFNPKDREKIFITNKIDVYYIDDIWNLDILDWNDYGTKDNRVHRYLLAVIDNFSNFGRAGPLKVKNIETIKTLGEKSYYFKKTS